MKVFQTIIAVVLGALLIYAEADFPAWASSKSPANAGELSQYYIKNIYDETLVPNMVTAVLADYRGYDTLFETVVVFTAGLAIFAILGTGVMREKKTAVPAPKRIYSEPPFDLIVRISTRMLVPVIQLFALYVLAHGHHSPGGGFQGGVILAASFIMLELSSDLRAEAAKLTHRMSIWLGIIGIVIYAGWGTLSLFFGGHFLDYDMLQALFPLDPLMARSHSMLIVEVGVAFTVSSIMLLIFRQLVSGGYSIPNKQA